MHFVNPEYFPIWDRRVARHFEIYYHYNINRFENYIEYIDFIESATIIFAKEDVASYTEIAQQLFCSAYFLGIILN